MKDLIRVKSLISNEIEMLLNQQIKKEAYSSAVYLSMASWCNRNGYDFSSDYFCKQSAEEREQQRKFYKYVLDMGGNAVAPEITDI